MDKELLRVVIILIGVLVMIGMVLWHFVKSLRERRTPDDYYDEDSYDDRVVDEFSVEEDDDEMDVFALGNELVDGDALLDDQAIKPSPKPSADALRKDVEKKQAATLANSRRLELPALIEFSIVARADQGFNGEDLFEAFERVGLRYGSVRVFERVDANRMVDFAVASMVDPGTFPDTGLQDFYCPGIVFFMQPREVDAPLAVFDDFMETIDTLADELDGVVWDNQRQPLTAETVAQFRQILAKAA
ncbi:cell division protein ZipA C-terminal FtsZ-binding domain-containing protein [Methylomonas sp. EFPC1]|uniref:Cell division protein ZipA n=1 Tax=Methylomonas defluvii TaxID=3045149 RepID=A0ABU4UM70_9GAMM|nr:MULTISPECIES: cell division protein ZipA C-terminal FtsZ-binding domain-containing protein [unclassified Methylomonas]MDX8129942.1 cell division protein ZipA C-terminal FtsZ-binding domain-containing protein [Methylomonas sp. OY6]NOV30488.1 cell division protein FtsZ [Methylomonas sp. ZR1]PKD38643.1 cell division protein FtsZ [Methylomonas sp. Kb3]QBC28567.1 cell division protein FtsZ [Methylomonas sp. LW13]QSB00240.1 cell division protein ZipA C-terminal FtsZ-binding domain-containing prot